MHKIHSTNSLETNTNSNTGHTLVREPQIPTQPDRTSLWLCRDILTELLSNLLPDHIPPPSTLHGRILRMLVEVLETIRY